MLLAFKFNLSFFECIDTFLHSTDVVSHNVKYRNDVLGHPGFAGILGEVMVATDGGPGKDFGDEVKVEKRR